MAKEKRIIVICLAIVLFSVVISLTFFGRGIKKAEVKKQPTVDLVQLENNYKLKTKEIVDSYLLLLQSDSINEQILMQIKDQLLSLKVPDKFKELHVELVLSIDGVGEDLKSGDQGKRLASIEILKKDKAIFDWLN